MMGRWDHCSNGAAACLQVWPELDNTPPFSSFIDNLCYIAMQAAAAFYVKVGSTFSRPSALGSEVNRVIWS